MPRDDDQLHPVLSEKEDHEQRGDNPPGSFGHTEPASGDLDPNWKPNDDVKNAAEELIKGLGREHRPRREDVYPYLMIRAYSPATAASGRPGRRPRVGSRPTFCSSTRRTPGRSRPGSWS